MSFLALVLALAAQQPAASSSARAVTEQAERAALEAVQLSASDPTAALARARQALDSTSEFEPTAFVRPGRKGEVVEDAFQAARADYERHRATLYEAVGKVLARQGRTLPAARYLHRAFLLDPTIERGLVLTRALCDLGRGREALDVVRRAVAGLDALSPEVAAAVGRAADVAGRPSAQAEIDRDRLKAKLGAAVTLREGPLELPAGARLSNAPVFRIEDAPLTLIYAAEASCRSCSADLDEIAHEAPHGVRVVALPKGDDQDAALRQVLGLYRRPWPLLLGRDVAPRLALEPRSVLLIARGGWTLAVLTPPFDGKLASAVAALQHADIQEQVPRAQWNYRPPDRSPLPPPPGLLPDGIAPGEDEPFPPEFESAVAAYRAHRWQEALSLFDGLARKGDGWLLPPEARLDRALCLAGMGRRDAARRLLLRTGDSRFEDAIDRLLEKVAQER